MHPRRAVDLALPPEQAAEREVQVDRLRIDLDDLDERLDRLVRLLVQQEIEAAKIRQRQRARFAQQVLDVDARRDPAQPEEQRRESAAATTARNPCAAMRDYASAQRRRSTALEAGPGAGRGSRHGAGARPIRGGAPSRARCSRRSRLELARQPRRAHRAGEQPGRGADREGDQDDEDERRLPAPPVVELERHELRVLQRQEQERQKERAADDPAQDCIATSQRAGMAGWLRRSLMRS